MRSNTPCQIDLIAVKQRRKLRREPRAERFLNDDAANASLQSRRFRGEWKLPEVWSGCGIRDWITSQFHNGPGSVLPFDTF